MGNVPVAMDEVLRVRGFNTEGDWETDIHIPISHSQFLGLKGRVLTHLEALGLPESQENAARGILRSMLTNWWNECIDNAATSAQGCIAPFSAKERFNSSGTTATNTGQNVRVSAAHGALTE